MSLTQKVKAEARRLGFELVGVTSPEPPPHWAVFERWLGAGRHAEMGYLASQRSRERRGDPRRILPECRSILALGTRYTPPDASPSPQEENGYPPRQGGLLRLGNGLSPGAA